GVLVELVDGVSGDRTSTVRARRTEHVDQRGREAIEAPSATRDEHVGHHIDTTIGDGVDSRDQRGRTFADGIALRLESCGTSETQRLCCAGLRETDRLRAVSLGLAGDPHERGFTLTLGLPSSSLVAADLDRHLRRRQLDLHLCGTARLLHLDTCGL